MPAYMEGNVCYLRKSKYLMIHLIFKEVIKVQNNFYFYNNLAGYLILQQYYAHQWGTKTR